MNFLGKMLLMMISKVTKTSASSSIWKIQFWKILQRGAGYRRGGERVAGGVEEVKMTSPKVFLGLRWGNVFF